VNNTLTITAIPFSNRFSLKKSFSLRRFLSLGIFLIITLSGLYALQTIRGTSEKYLFLKYEKEFSVISEENKNLAVKSSQIISLDKVSNLLDESCQGAGLTFEKINKVHYIRPLETQLVSK